MPTQKYEWRSIAIPQAMYANILKVIPFTGHCSVSEYIREKVRHQLNVDLLKFENFEEEKERQRKDESDLVEE